MNKNPQYHQIIKIVLMMIDTFESKNWTLWQKLHNKLFEETNFYHKGIYRSDKMLSKFADIIDSQTREYLKIFYPKQYKILHCNNK